MLPAGPTVRDEVAGAAFFFGLMVGLSEEELLDIVMALPTASNIRTGRFSSSYSVRVVLPFRSIIDSTLPLASYRSSASSPNALVTVRMRLSSSHVISVR